MASPLKSLDDVIRRVGDAASSGTIRAYHGSPYDFDRFDASKIGTGEGAQAYGHGLYFAGVEDTAKSYRDSLSGQVLIDGEPMSDSVAGNDYILAHALANKQHDQLAAWRKTAQQRYDHFSRLTDEARARYQKDPEGEGVLAELGRVKHAAELEADVLAAFRRLDGKRVELNPGRMYEVEIAHPESSLLDWDASFARQPPAVQESLRTLGITEDDMFSSGRGIMWAVRDTIDPMKMPPDARSAAIRMAEHGVPGVRYLDRGSRRAGDGTRNYVMFPGTEDSIRILRKYGLLAPIAAGAAYEDGQQPVEIR